MKVKILLFLLLIGSGLNGQTFTNTYTTMNVYFNNRPGLKFPINTIDTITYSINQVVCPTTVNDTDGNIYNVIQIGNQCWMKENLKTSRYSNGMAIPTGLSDTDWTNTTIGAFSDYNNDTSLVADYGRLYNWYAVVDTANVCPVGWHVPKQKDWDSLYLYIDPSAQISSNNVGSAQNSLVATSLKETGLTHWASPNANATNYWRFTALPGGKRDYNGVYSGLNYYGYYWSSSVEPTFGGGLYRMLYYNSTVIVLWSGSETFGASVRCLKD
jgi:uncharacterized protein (TIGR02145 family)